MMRSGLLNIVVVDYILLSSRIKISSNGGWEWLLSLPSSALRMPSLPSPQRSLLLASPSTGMTYSASSLFPPHRQRFQRPPTTDSSQKFFGRCFLSKNCAKNILCSNFASATLTKSCFRGTIADASNNQNSFRNINFKTMARSLTSKCNAGISDNGYTSAKVHYSNTATCASKRIIQGTIPSHGTGIKVGQFSECHRIFSQEDVCTFGELIGDLNPVHFPSTPNNITNHNQSDHSTKSHKQYAPKEKTPIVHGILLSSLFSTIYGTLVPGSIYRTQTLKFQSAVHVDEEVVGRVVVTKAKQIPSRRGMDGGVLCTCDTAVVTCSKSDKNCNTQNKIEETEEVVCVSGEAQVWLPGATLA